MNSKRCFRAEYFQLIAALVCALWPVVSMRAQSAFSVNALAYIDANFAAGSNLVANPLSTTDNTISNLFRGVPDGSLFLPWDGASRSFRPTNSYSAASGWTEPSATLVLPSGGLLWLPTARKVTFVGEVFQGAFTGQTYPAGLWVLSVIPRDGFVICADIDECPPQPPMDMTFSKWNRATQRYETYTYLGPQPGFGWVDENFNPADPQLEPAESGLFSVPSSFWVPSLAGTAQTNNSIRVALQDVRRGGNDLTFRFAATNGMPYSVFRCTDLTVNTWEMVQQGNASASNGFATVTIAAATNDTAFYRVWPQITAWNPYLMNESRSDTQFRFQFYAPTGTVYQVQRTLSLTAPPPMWQTIQSVAAGPNSIVTVTDTNATAPSGYYRIQY